MMAKSTRENEKALQIGGQGVIWV